MNVDIDVNSILNEYEKILSEHTRKLIMLKLENERLRDMLNACIKKEGEVDGGTEDDTL